MRDDKFPTSFFFSRKIKIISILLNAWVIGNLSHLVVLDPYIHLKPYLSYLFPEKVSENSAFSEGASFWNLCTFPKTIWCSDIDGCVLAHICS